MTRAIIVAVLFAAACDSSASSTPLVRDPACTQVADHVTSLYAMHTRQVTTRERYVEQLAGFTLPDSLRLVSSRRASYRAALEQECNAWPADKRTFDCLESIHDLRNIDRCPLPRTPRIAEVVASHNFSEAGMVLLRLADRAKSLRPGRLSAVPATPTCYRDAATAKLWNKKSWRRVWGRGFAALTPPATGALSLEIETTKTAAVLRARGDADCDGVTSLVELTVPRRRGGKATWRVEASLE